MSMGERWEVVRGLCVNEGRGAMWDEAVEREMSFEMMKAGLANGDAQHDDEGGLLEVNLRSLTELGFRFSLAVRDEERWRAALSRLDGASVEASLADLVCEVMR